MNHRYGYVPIFFSGLFKSEMGLLVAVPGLSFVEMDASLQKATA